MSGCEKQPEAPFGRFQVETMVRALCLMAAHKIHAERLLADEADAVLRVVARLCNGGELVVRYEENRLIIEW